MSPRLAALLLLALSAIAAGRPVWMQREPPPAVSLDVASPEEFEGRPLEAAPLHPVEARFAREFPGVIAAFESGGRRVIWRRIDRATRKLHPAEGCLRAAGFDVRAGPARRFPDSGLWATFVATKDGRALLVREQITDRHGRTWTDVSAWYWAAQLHPRHGPWQAVTVIEPLADPRE